MRNLLAVIFLGFIVLNAHAQQPFQVCTDSTFCIPGIAGTPRPKGIIIERQRMVNFKITTSTIEGFENAENKSTILSNDRWKFKIRAPLRNKKSFKIATEFRYFVESYEFSDVAQSDNPLFQNFENKSLRSYGLSLFGLKAFIGNRYLLNRVSVSLNGDFNTPEIESGETLKASYSIMYGIKINPFKSLAFGVNFSNNFGRFGIVPLLSYNASHNNRWLLESILPINVKLNYLTFNKKNIIAIATGLNGGNYNLLFTERALEEPKLFLRKAELHTTLNYEREIHDWFWFGIELGWNKNIEFNVTKTIHRDDLVIESDVGDSFFTAVRFFIVPPRKFLK